MAQPRGWVLPVIVFSQFTGTSLWFAGNAVAEDLRQAWFLPEGVVGHITSSVQFGFIVGTLVFAFFALSDRISPRLLFFGCSILGGLANGAILFSPPGLIQLVVLRFMTGFFLAGIYPVGMKIAASWYAQDLGRAIGFLVGALVLGTAFPHLVKSWGTALPWQTVMLTLTVTAVLGGTLLLILVPDGPHLPKSPAAFQPRALLAMFRDRDFRAASFGYFGHMWELYAFWAFLPFFLGLYHSRVSPLTDLSLWSFALIAVGFFGCAFGGILSRRHGSARVAQVQLVISGLCCLLSPLSLQLPKPAFLLFMTLWGVTVIGDSPQFSALTARTAPRDRVGSALTMVTCIGFSITILSIQLLNTLSGLARPEFLFLALAPGPLFGTWSTLRLVGRM